MRRSASLVIAASMLVAACAGSDSNGEDGADGDAANAEVDEPAAEPAAEPAPEPERAEEPAAEPAESDAGEPVDESEPATPIVDAVEIVPSPLIGLAASVEIDVSAETHVRLTAVSGDHVVETPVTAAAASRHELPLVGMRPDRDYAVSVQMVDEAGADMGEPVDGGVFTTEPLPPWFADHEIEILDAERMSSGFTIVEFDRQFSGDLPEGAPSPQYLLAYDDEGEPVWWYTNTGTLAGIEQTDRGTIMNFYWPIGIRETDVLGQVVAHWAPQPRDVEVADVADPELAVEGVDPDQVEFTGGLAAATGNPGDVPPVPFVVPWMDVSGIHHEAWPMPNGNILTLSITEHELTDEQRQRLCPGDDRPFNAVSDVAIEFEPDGTVVRTWDLWDAIDIDEVPGISMCLDGGIFAGENNRDWNHANSVTYDPVRDAVIISSRHTDQIIAFDHLDEVGHQTQVRWILGEAATIPLDGEPTYHQHAVEVMDDGNLVVYDNGNTRPTMAVGDPDNPPYSRAVIYEVDDSSDDPADWSARQVWEHIDVEANGKRAYSTFISDADPLPNGNVLVTHGGIGAFPPSPDDPLHILIREVVPDGESGGDVVWELRSDPDVPHVTYRAERIESFYVGPLWQS